MSKDKFTKLKSRTFWLAIVWSLYVPLAIISQLILAKMGVETVIALPVGAIVTAAGAIVSLYVGGNKGKQIATASGAPKGEEGKDNEDD